MTKIYALWKEESLKWNTIIMHWVCLAIIILFSVHVYESCITVHIFVHVLNPYREELSSLHFEKRD